MEDTLFAGAVVFVALLFGLAVLCGIAELIERFIDYRRRNDQRELLPPPNCRAVVRRRGWNVPL